MKKSHSKSKFSWIIVGITLFIAGSFYWAIYAGTGPLSFLTKTPDINKVVDCKGDDDCIEANAIAKKQGLKGAQYDQAVQQVTQTLKKDNVYVEKMTVKERNKPEAEDPAEDVPAAQQVVISQPVTPCQGGQQSVTTSTGNHCVPLNGDEIACGVYAKSIDNKCYPIGYKEGEMELCDWTVRDVGKHYAFFSLNCPTATDYSLGIPKNSDECSKSKEFPGWWSENEKTCVQVGQVITGSPLIVCGAGQRTDKPEYTYPTASLPEVCPSYIAPPVIPPAPAVLSNEELERRQEDCRSSIKKYDIASGACIDLVKCTPVPLTTGAKSYTTCGSDGKIELKLCNNPAGFDANGLCPITPPVATPITPNAPSEEFRCGERGGTWRNGACLSPGSLEPRPGSTALNITADPRSSSSPRSTPSNNMSYGEELPAFTIIERSSECNNALLYKLNVGENGQQLSSSYVPPNIVDAGEALPNIIVRSDAKINHGAVEPLEELAAYTESRGFTLVLLSGYRSYEEQEHIHDDNPDGSAPAGDSQHQTGVAVDLELIDNTTGKRVAVGLDIIQKATELGMLHPLAGDGPHFIVTQGVISDESYDAMKENLQEDINSNNTYYSQLNREIEKVQNNCKKAVSTNKSIKGKM